MNLTLIEISSEIYDYGIIHPKPIEPPCNAYHSRAHAGRNMIASDLGRIIL